MRNKVQLSNVLHSTIKLAFFFCNLQKLRCYILFVVQLRTRVIDYFNEEYIYIFIGKRVLIKKICLKAVVKAFTQISH